MKFEDMLENRMEDQIWSKYCGFLELDIDQYMEIQNRLLMEQIGTLAGCVLGKRLLGGALPADAGEFRSSVRLTNYHDYADYLVDKREDVLPDKPAFWIETTWADGTHPIKRAPCSQEMIDTCAGYAVYCMLMATGDRKGDYHIERNDKTFFGMAPLPYFTGLTPYGLSREISLEYLPSLEQAVALDFKERNKLGFELGLRKGIDLIIGASVILVKIGESFSGVNRGKRTTRFWRNSLHMNYRLVKAVLASKFNRKPLLPKDVWPIKGVVCGGTDSVSFKERIEYLWGKRPLEVYAGTELGMVGAESWSKTGMTFFPDLNFYEFIPERESAKSLEEPGYVPSTLLMNQVVPGEIYEIVVTNLKGGIFTRYRVGDMVRCLSLSNPADGIRLPQFAYVDRISNVIDIAAFTRITKSTIEAAVAASGIRITDWIAFKKYDENRQPRLHLLVGFDNSEIPAGHGNT